MKKLLADRYDLIKNIGHGGMADVFLAIDTVLNREVAIKMIRNDKNLDPVNLLRFKQEAKAAATLNHQNIIEIYDVGEYKNRSFIVMEYIKGYTLKHFLNKKGPFIVEEAVIIMKQITSAVKHAHDKGIIHRDLKTQNITVKTDGTIKILDFGIALAHDSLELTKKDSVMGSIYYLSPEVVKGGQANVQSDIYALGIIFYELLVGDVPFKGEQLVEVALNHIHEKLPSIRDYNPNVLLSMEMIINKACSKDLSFRYSDTSQMLTDLNHCLDPKVNNFIQDIKTNNKPSNNGKRLKELNKELAKKSFDSEVEDVNEKNTLFYLMVFAMTLLAGIAFVAILYFAGFINVGLVEHKMPNIIDMSVDEANDILVDLGGQIDYNNIKNELTLDVEKGLIIDANLEVGDNIEKGALISVTVSSGIYSIMDDFTNYNIEDAKLKIDELFDNVRIKTVSEVSDTIDAGFVLRQEGLLPNDKFDDKKENTITLYYSAYNTIFIENILLGMDIYDAKYQLEAKGIVVEVVELKKEELTDYEKERLMNTNVIRTSPEIGTTYTQLEDTKLTLYYVKSES